MNWSIGPDGSLTVTSNTITSGTVSTSTFTYTWPRHLAPPDEGTAGVREPRRPKTPLSPYAAALAIPSQGAA